MAESIEAGKPAPVASLERALDQVIDFLGRAEHVPRARALAIEARRLRAIVGKWRSIEPPEDVREEMITRVLRLASDAEEVVAEAGPAGAPPNLPAGRGSAPRLPAYVEPPTRASSPELPRVAPPPGRGSSPELPRIAPPPGRGSAPDLSLTVPMPPPAEKPTEVSRYAPDALPPLDGPTAMMPQIPDLDADDADAAFGPPTIPRRPPEPRLMGQPPLIISTPGPSIPRVPTLQFERVVPPPGPEIIDAEIIDSVPPERFRRGQAGSGITVEPAPPEPQATAPDVQERRDSIAEPPSLIFEPPEPPPSMRDEAETALFTLPSGIKELQAISVVPARRPAELDPNLVMITDPYSKRADAYRALRRKLAAGSARIIAITSAKPKEGKTICAINLAYALAESSPRNILVVEANIRSPGLATTLKFDPQICFTEQLRRRRKDEDEPWVVVDQSGTGPVDDVSGAPSMRGGSVHLLAVDPKAERPPMLDAVAFSKGMQSLKRAGYEYIIVDTPAVLGTLDMQIIGDAVDGVIFTSIVKRSTRKPLKDAIEQIKPAPVLGVIVLEG